MFSPSPADAAYHLVLGLSSVLTPITGGLSAAVAIVVFTAGSAAERAILWRETAPA